MEKEDEAFSSCNDFLSKPKMSNSEMLAKPKNVKIQPDVRFGQVSRTWPDLATAN
jgi:hypothetical protein